MIQFKHYYYMMKLDMSKNTITNEQLVTYKELLKTLVDKQIKHSKYFYEMEDDIVINKQKDAYGLRMCILFRNKNAARISYFVHREDMEYCNFAIINVDINKNNEYLLVIPMGENKTMLMLNCFEIISNNE